MKKVIYLLTAASFLFGACSTSNKVAQQKDYNDDVYYSKAKAIEISAIAKAEYKNKNMDEWDDNSYNNYSGGGIYYSVTPWRSFYNNSYNPFYDPYLDYFGYNSWYNPGITIIGVNSPWLYTNSYRNIYGYPYFNSFYGGPVSYNNYYPGYSYSGYSGGNYNTGVVYNDPNYRARPSRGSENIGGLAKSMETIRRDGQGAIMISPNRGESYGRNNTSASSTGRTSSTGTTTTVRERPSRTQSDDMQRRNIDISTRSVTPQTSSSQPSSGNYSGGGNSSSSSSDDGSRSRPARAGN